MRSIYKKIPFHCWEYQERYQKGVGKKIATGICRARLNNFWKKEAIADTLKGN